MKKGMKLAVMVVSVMTGCGEDPTEMVEQGALEVSVVFTADALDEDGFTAVVDGDMSSAVTPDDVATFTLDVGAHSVELTGVDETCTVEGENPRDITVEADVTVTTEYSIECIAS